MMLLQAEACSRSSAARDELLNLSLHLCADASQSAHMLAFGS